MAAITTRQTTGGGATVKGSPLSNLELDTNFININTELGQKAPLGGAGTSGTWSISITGNAATVTDGVYLSGTQTISGNKTFSGSVSFSNTITGSITGNAGTVGTLGLPSTVVNNEANKIVRTDGSGYIQAGWISTTSGDNGTATMDRVYASSDGYIRYYTPANFRTVLDVPTRGGSGASGTWGISVSGNAATVTNGVYTSGDQTVAGNKTFSGLTTMTGGAQFNQSQLLALFSTSSSRYYIGNDGTNWFLNRHNSVGTYQNTPLYVVNSSGDLHSNGGLVLHTGNYGSYTPIISNSGVGDMNQVYASGIYGFEATPTNGPGFSYGHMLVLRQRGDTIGQLAVDYNTGNMSVRGAYLPNGNSTVGAVWSPWRTVYHSGTFTYSNSVSANHVVQRDSNGYIYANYINFNTGQETGTINSVFFENGDGWIRKMSRANFIAGLAITGTPALNVVTSTTQTAVAGNHYVLTNAAVSTVTLPASPVSGDVVWVTPGNSRSDNVIARNGQNIMSLAEDMIINNQHATVQLRFINATLGWRLT